MLFPSNDVNLASKSFILKSEFALTHCFNDLKEELTCDIEEPNDNIGDTIEDSCEVSAKDEDLEISDSYEDIKVKHKRTTWKNGAKVGKRRIRGPFSCTVCDSFFQSHDILMNHVNHKHGPKVGPKCQICDQSFDSNGARDYHKIVKHSDKEPCLHCKKILPVSLMKQHIQRAHEECDPKACNKCGAVYTNLCKFNEHIRHHCMFVNKRKPNSALWAEENKNAWLEKYKKTCFCNLHLPTNKKKIEHYKLAHDDYKKCTKCERVVKDLETHNCVKKVTKKPQPQAACCSTCGKSFKSASSLWTHVKIQHDNVLSECEICGRVFKSLIMVRQHINRTHKEKDACPICGKLVSNLKLHIGSMHTDQSEMPFKCEICGKGCSSTQKYERHMHVHSNDKSFKCREGCDMAYRDISNRNQHEKKVHRM